VWWIWLIVGMVLIGLEIIVPGVSLIWFGISALVVGTVNYFFAMPLTLALLLWIVIGGIILGIVLKYQKKWSQKENGRIDVNRHLIDSKRGVVVEKVDQFFARAKFEEPILGDREWQVKGENLEVGDIVEILSVEGNYFKVQKIPFSEKSGDKSKNSPKGYSPTDNLDSFDYITDNLETPNSKNYAQENKSGNKKENINGVEKGKSNQNGGEKDDLEQES